MKQVNVPFYTEQQFENGEATYPCSSKYMEYHGMEHKYYLTAEALAYYGIDVERRYISSSNNKVTEFIDKVTQKVYNYIQYKSGWKNYGVQMYRIAKGIAKPYNDAYTYRKEFERALVEQAKYLIENGDSAKYSAYNMEQGERQPLKPEEEFRDNSDIATETKRILDFLGLTRWFSLGSLAALDPNQY